MELHVVQHWKCFVIKIYLVLKEELLQPIFPNLRQNFPNFETNFPNCKGGGGSSKNKKKSLCHVGHFRNLIYIDYGKGLTQL